MGRKSFRGGIHPPEQKSFAEDIPIQNLPLPERVIIPLQQHIGAPAEPVVEKGDAVKTGQIIGKASKFVSLPVHASISGTVVSVNKRPHPLGTDLLAIEIEGDGANSWKRLPKDEDVSKLSAEDKKKRILDAGIAGLGGATFPTHVKLTPPPEKPIDTLIINGVECEPYLTADHRLMLEKPNEILAGARIMADILKSKKIIIGIEDNKLDAIRLLRKKTRRFKTISVLSLSVKYPQGGEKQLIKAATGREVPAGRLPMDVGCVVQNVGTAFAVHQAVTQQRPLIERIVTVTGTGINSPKNCRVRIGTPVADLISFCGGYTSDDVKLISGGPMMGISQWTDTIPVIKGTSGILVMKGSDVETQEEQPCISCARCVDICPMRLTPNKIATFVEYKRLSDAKENRIYDCMECGSCSFICPAKRHLVQYIKLGKALCSTL
ncbi:electron transport complex subunit RsxC [candidate division KSB1 bacterium]|nr:electron transport complex subunit RsxC [candidate division KSB1 bacterium]